MRTLSLTYTSSTGKLAITTDQTGAVIDNNNIRIKITGLPEGYLSAKILYGVQIETDTGIYYPFSELDSDGECLIPSQVCNAANTGKLPIALKLTYENGTVEASVNRIIIALTPYPDSEDSVIDAFPEQVMVRGSSWDWLADWEYSEGAIVCYDGQYWRSVADSNTGHAPADPSDYWDGIGTKGDTGPQGPQGPQGPIGVGIPTGGTDGQVLAKRTSEDYDFQWYDLPGAVQYENAAVIFQLQQTPDNANYPYRATFNVADVTSDYFAIVVYSAAQAGSGAYAPFCVTFDGGVYLYANADVGTQTIPTISIGRDYSVMNVEGAPIPGNNNPISSSGVFYAMLDKAPVNHASVQNIYGMATTAQYGHVKVDDSMIDDSPNPVQGGVIKAFVNSSIATSTADFCGTYDVVTDLGLTVNATNEQIAEAIPSVVASPTNNDYVFVSIDYQTDTDIDQYRRFKFNGTSWLYEYTLNNSSFTQAQWNAINSGLSANDKTKLDGIEAGAQVNPEVTDNNPTLSWGNVFTIGTVGNTPLRVTMPVNPDADAKTSSADKPATKLFLIGAEAQSADGQTTFSNSDIYIGEDDKLHGDLTGTADYAAGIGSPSDSIGSDTKPIKIVNGVPVAVVNDLLDVATPQTVAAMKTLSGNTSESAPRALVLVSGTDTEYIEYPYKFSFIAAGTTASNTAIVIFTPDYADSGIIAPVCDTGTDTIYIWSKKELPPNMRIGYMIL